MKLKNISKQISSSEEKMKKKIVLPLAFHAEDLKVKCPMKEKKKKETKYTLAFHAEGKKPRV